MSTSPAATSAALPDDEPPVEWLSSHGLRTGPVREVCEPPEKQRSSHTALPMIVAPACSIRVTMVASRRGTYPSMVSEPFISGTPATAVLSLIATVRPASGPVPLPLTSQVTYQALNGLSAASGRLQARSGMAGAEAWYSSSTASQEASRPATIGPNCSRSAASRPSP